MANINEFLLKIKEAIYGEEVRGSIHDALDAMNKECINAEAVAISSRDSARHQANKSEEQANRSEAWAVGSIYGQDVPPEDPQYKNNAKYWGKYAQKYAEGGVRWKGSVTFDEIPRDGNLQGDMYNVSTAFYTDERFDETPGTFCPARTNIIYNEVGLWDISTGNIAGYSDAEFETYQDAIDHIDELENGQTVYIRQKKQDALNANLAYVEHDQESSRAYEKNKDLLIFNRALYRVIKDIAIGDTLEVHENIEPDTIANQLKDVAKNANPVGAVIYTTICDTEAKVIETYGGNHWIQHTGYFLRGADSNVTENQAQSDGGNDNAVVVQHSHGVSVSGGNHTHSVNQSGGNQNDNIAQAGARDISVPTEVGASNVGYSGNLSMSGTAANNGAWSNGVDANIPKYKNVYIWERVS